VKFSVHQVSRKGGRAKNEDRMGYCYTREAGLFALADGMGGHPEGDVAAQLALQALAGAFQRDATPALADPAAFLHDGLLAGHHLLRDYAARKGLPDTPRTTLIACVMQADAAWWAHCGDSRLYLVRKGELMVRTRDHSFFELQRAAPAVGGGERVSRNVLFTCLGSPSDPVVDLAGPLWLEGGDRVLLCSDGLWGGLGDELITAQIAGRPVSESVPELVEMALRKGGRKCDNVTALGVEWESADHAADHAADDDFATTIQPASPEPPMAPAPKRAVPSRP
jgi:serine/threonine protein phosphatase PrpC